MKILVTGGAGYIGSHTLISLIEAGFNPVVVDNLSNSSIEAIKRVNLLTATITPIEVFNLEDSAKLESVFSEHEFEAVIHFAGLKAVGESTKQPLLYYRTNIDSTLTLLEMVRKYSIKKVIFSSSATVYGSPQTLPLTEESSTPAKLNSPYGQTKLMIEHILQDIVAADPKMAISILRYFNPIGAHKSGQIGEDPKGQPNNLLPYIAQVATGKRQFLSVWGDDYPTPDGTGVRDYIHVMDLADGHIAALQHSKPGVTTFNLGTGKGYSVLELVKAFEKASGKRIPYKIKDRRPGDIATCYADPTKAMVELGWKTKRNLATMCQDSWRWQSKNPNGYA